MKKKDQKCKTCSGKGRYFAMDWEIKLNHLRKLNRKRRNKK
jgi:predicted methyltransferase